MCKRTGRKSTTVIINKNFGDLPETRIKFCQKVKIVFRFVNSLTILLQAGHEDELSHYFTHLFDLAFLIKYIKAACYLNWFKLPIVAVHLQATLEPSSRVSVISVIIIVYTLLRLAAAPCR